MAAAVFLVWKPRRVETDRKSISTGSHQVVRRLVDAHGISYEYDSIGVSAWQSAPSSDTFSSFLGIGGGIIHVPALSYFLNFPIHLATATSHFILAIMALTGTVVHILTGTFAHGVHRTIALAIGVVLGAQIGARMSEKVQGAWIIRALAIALGIVGLRILIVAW